MRHILEGDNDVRVVLGDIESFMGGGVLERAEAGGCNMTLEDADGD